MIKIKLFYLKSTIGCHLCVHLVHLVNCIYLSFKWNVLLLLDSNEEDGTDQYRSKSVKMEKFWGSINSHTNYRQAKSQNPDASFFRWTPALMYIFITSVFIKRGENTGDDLVSQMHVFLSILSFILVNMTFLPFASQRRVLWPCLNRVSRSVQFISVWAENRRSVLHLAVSRRGRSVALRLNPGSP